MKNATKIVTTLTGYAYYAVMFSMVVSADLNTGAGWAQLVMGVAGAIAHAYIANQD